MKALSVLALALASLWLVPAALAVPPANDDFADAEVLGPGLPVAVTRTNVEATKEAGEPAVGSSSSKESVWFEWVAPSTGFVTVGACNGQIDTTLGIFTGTAVSSLVKVVEGNANEGPHCPFRGSEFTFKSTAGTSYKIGVAGEAFFPPGGTKPVTEGEFELRIEATPLPGNDDFQNAALFQGEIEEEPGGERFYIATGLGFNWGATKQAGEPNHAGDPGGASVWYSWTAPESGFARINACCGPPPLLGVYAGGAMGSLVLVEPTPDPLFGPGYVVSAGTAYRIAVDGKFDAGAGAAAMGSFEIKVFMQLPARPQLPAPTASLPPDRTPPNTTIRKRILRSLPPVVVLRFDSNEDGSTFRCKLDKRPFASCRQPFKKFRNLRPGRHTFKVVAIDAAGNVDPSPAVARFTIAATSSKAGRSASAPR